MKATHLITPRTLEQGRFEPDAQAIWILEENHAKSLLTRFNVSIVVLIGIISVLFLLLMSLLK
jgi:hypothetical protein